MSTVKDLKVKKQQQFFVFMLLCSYKFCMSAQLQYVKIK